MIRVAARCTRGNYPQWVHLADVDSIVNIVVENVVARNGGASSWATWAYPAGLQPHVITYASTQALTHIASAKQHPQLDATSDDSAP